MKSYFWIILDSVFAAATKCPANSSIAVFGDWPYNLELLFKKEELIKSINNENPTQVIHVGDIHQGAWPCNSTYNQMIAETFNKFNSPVIYTPGDNEWTDCQKKKSFYSGAPLEELANLRKVFFPTPGVTMGIKKKRVKSQALEFDPKFPSDAEYVENIIFTQSKVIIVTINLPGGNNDLFQWSKDGPIDFEGDGTARLAEYERRNAANMRWLEKAFRMAKDHNSAGVMIATQANMWDPEANAETLKGYLPVISLISELTLDFGKPVLLLNGDSHSFIDDYPLLDTMSRNGQIFKLPSTPNLHRITVQGAEDIKDWLKVTINPSSKQVFSYKRIYFL
jgi:hypothetical protein